MQNSRFDRRGDPFRIEVLITTPPNVKEVTKEQKKILLGSLELADGNGTIGICLWRKNAELVKRLSLGTRTRLEKVYTKKRGLLESSEARL